MIRKNMKYLIFEMGNLPPQAILIPKDSGLQHADVYVKNSMGIEGKVVNGGFCQLSYEGASCYGESVSLGVKSSPKDEEIINRLFYEIW